MKAKNVFCSISSKVADYSETEPFTLNRINPHHCSYLLIDHQSSLLSPAVVDQLKTTNADLKVLLTFDADENANIDQWKEEIERKKGDGINLLINANQFSAKITRLIKVMSLAMHDSSSNFFFQTIPSILSDGNLLTVSFQLPSDPSQQVSFFNVLELHQFVDYMLILPFDETSIRTSKEIQHWNALATFIRPDPSKSMGDFSMV